MLLFVVVVALLRTADAFVRTAYDRVMVDLVEEHAEIRLSAFQLSNELFQRSHVFRELLISEFQKFVYLPSMLLISDSHFILPVGMFTNRIKIFDRQKCP